MIGETGQSGSIGADTIAAILGGGSSPSQIYGAIPGVANPTGAAGTAIKGDIGNLSNLAELTQGVDTIAAAGASLPYEMNLPGYDALKTSGSYDVLSELGGNVPGMPGYSSDMNQASTDTAQDLSGQLPQDVVNQIEQSAAERGVSSGQGAGSPNTNAQLLQSLGLNSLQQQQTGLSNLGTLEGISQGVTNSGISGLSTLIGDTPTGSELSPSSMLVSPQTQQEAQQAALNAQAAPNPGDSGAMSTVLSCL